MKDIILKAENISKQYRLGLVGTGTVQDDLKRWWYGVRGKEDPFLKIGERNDRSTKGSSDYVWALQDINFEVERGEVLGIIGKNGAGKSTLLKILSKVTSPTTGAIKTRGRIASLLEVGTGFHGEMTGRENIYLNGAILGMTKKEIHSKIDAIIDFSGCERYIDTPVKRYSSGMTVRLAFAVAAFLEPEILVVDEVLAVGDAEFQKKAIGKMQDISKGEGRTVLFVSHNMAAVKNLCMRGIVLDGGRIVYGGDVNDSVNFYLNMNTIDTQVNLKDRIDRIGNGAVKITDIVFKNLIDNRKIDSLITGGGVKIEIHYELIDLNLIGSNLEVGLSFYSNTEHFITVLNNVMLGSYHKIDNQKGFVQCCIDKFPLTEGVFNIRAVVRNKNFIFDMLNNASEIFVHKGDFYGFGRVNSFGRQGVYINQVWD